MILDPIFNPLLKLSPLLAIFIVSLVISIIVTLVYKWMTNQKLMKELKEDIKKHQKEMKENKKDPKKLMEINKKAMEKNMKYMMQSFKPTIITIIPIFLIFAWLNAHLAYEPIKPGQEFTTTAIFKKEITGAATIVVPEGIKFIGDDTQEIKDGQAKWGLVGEEGEYVLEYKFDEKSFTREVLITEERSYKSPVVNVKDNEIKILRIDNKPVKPIWKLNWIWTYIILSIVFSMLFRKILKIY